eukprot:COSAG02_NODE_708_length_18231_cov_53.208416_7_plen_91_part_00
MTYRYTGILYFDSEFVDLHVTPSYLLAYPCPTCITWALIPPRDDSHLLCCATQYTYRAVYALLACDYMLKCSATMKNACGRASVIYFTVK